MEVDKCDLVCSNCHRIRTAGNPVIAEKIRAKNLGYKHLVRKRPTPLSLEAEQVRRRKIGEANKGNQKAHKAGVICH
jgi:hypothetical protein